MADSPGEDLTPLERELSHTLAVAYAAEVVGPVDPVAAPLRLTEALSSPALGARRLDHRAVVRAFFPAAGWTGEPQSDGTVSGTHPSGGTLVVSFDEQGRVPRLRGAAGGGRQEPSDLRAGAEPTRAGRRWFRRR